METIHKYIVTVLNVKFVRYLRFYSMRNHGLMGVSGNSPSYTSVHVHANALLVDDRKAIIGSASISDRSLDGTRDTELDVVIEHKAEECINGTMAGKPYLVSPLVRNLRCKLWENLSGGAVKSEESQDPILSGVLLQDLAHSNSKAYSKIFESLPENTFKLTDLKEVVVPVQRYRELASKIHGFVIEYPQEFLKDEEMPAIDSSIKESLMWKRSLM